MAKVSIKLFRKNLEEEEITLKEWCKTFDIDEKVLDSALNGYDVTITVKQRDAILAVILGKNIKMKGDKNGS